MSWQDRLGPAAYRSPSGEIISFIYEDLDKEITKHGTPFDFPDFDGTFAQPLGRSGRRLPMRIIFSGDNYDLEADIFDAMVNESGTGTLSHPMYGSIQVVILGRVLRSDRVKTRGNQAVFTLTFYETTDLLFPLEAASASEDLQTAIDAFNAASPPEFEEVIDIDTTSLLVSITNQYQAVKDVVVTGLTAVSEVTDTIEAAFLTVDAAINDAIDVFIADPLTLAFQTSILIQLPARSAALIADRLDAYGNLLTSIVTNNVGTSSVDATNSNAFRSDSLLASNLLVASAVAVLNNEFTTKTAALEAADILLTQLADYIEWYDDNLVSLDLIDTGAAYQQIINTISTAAGFLVEISFSLAQERSIVLTEPATPINLEAKYYKTIDENLDFIINSNALVGNLIFEVPAGFEFKYYV